METPKPQAGTWTLTAPDGRTWEASSPLHCCGAEQRERVPADVALARILEAATQTPDEVDAERYRWLRKQDWFDGDLCVLKAPRQVLTQGRGLGADCPSHDRLDAAIDAAMR